MWKMEKANGKVQRQNEKGRVIQQKKGSREEHRKNIGRQFADKTDI